MKSLILATMLTITATTSYAGGYDHNRYGNHHNHHNRGAQIHRNDDSLNWLVPAIVGGVLVYGVTRQPQDTTVVIQNNCTPWTEVQNPNGTITRTRTCTQ